MVEREQHIFEVLLVVVAAVGFVPAGEQLGAEAVPVIVVAVLGEAERGSQLRPLAQQVLAAPERSDLFPLDLTHAQPRVAQCVHDILGADRARTENDGLLMQRCGHVIVIEIEGPPGHAEMPGEEVQLVVVAVGHEVAEERAVRRPHGRVDEDRHVCRLARRACLEATIRECRWSRLP